MAFSLTSRNVSVDIRGVLHAECQTSDGQWNSASLDLNAFVGNHDGALCPGGEQFTQTARIISLDQMQAKAFLQAQLQKKDYPWAWQLSRLDLDKFVCNDEGKLCMWVFRYCLIVIISDNTSRSAYDAVISAAAEILRVHPRLRKLDFSEAQEILQATVDGLRDEAAALQDDTRESLRSCIAAAVRTHNAAVEAVRDAQANLIEGNKDRVQISWSPFTWLPRTAPNESNARSLIRTTAKRLNEVLTSANNDLSALQDAAARGVANLVEFQDARITEGIARLKKAEDGAISALEQARHREVEFTRSWCTVKERMETEERAAAYASKRAEQAQSRAIGFSWASIFLPIVFVPLLIAASAEKKEWISNHIYTQDRMEIMHSQKESYTVAVCLLEHVQTLAISGMQEYQELRDNLWATSEETRAFEHNIRDIQAGLTKTCRELGRFETQMATQFEYSRTLEEGLHILKDLASLQLQLPNGDLGD